MKKYFPLCFLLISVLVLAACQRPGSSAVSSDISIPESSGPAPVSNSASRSLPAYNDAGRYANLLIDLNSLQEFCAGNNPKTADIAAQNGDLYYSDGISIYGSSSDGRLISILPDSFGIPILGVLACDNETVYFKADAQSEASMHGAFYLYSLHIPTGKITNVSEEIGYANRPVQKAIISGGNLFIALYPTGSDAAELLRVSADKEAVSLSKDFSFFSACGSTVYFGESTTVFAIQEQSTQAVALFEIYGYSFEIAGKYLYLLTNSPKSSSCSIIDLETFTLIKKIEHAENSELQYASNRLIGIDYVYDEVSGTVPTFSGFDISVYSGLGQKIAEYSDIRLDVSLAELNYAVTDFGFCYFDGKTVQTCSASVPMPENPLTALTEQGLSAIDFGEHYFEIDMAPYYKTVRWVCSIRLSAPGGIDISFGPGGEDESGVWYVGTYTVQNGTIAAEVQKIGFEPPAEDEPWIHVAINAQWNPILNDRIAVFTFSRPSVSTAEFDEWFGPMYDVALPYQLYLGDGQ